MGRKRRKYPPQEASRTEQIYILRNKEDRYISILIYMYIFSKSKKKKANLHMSHQQQLTRQKAWEKGEGRTQRPRETVWFLQHNIRNGSRTTQCSCRAGAALAMERNTKWHRNKRDEDETNVNGSCLLFLLLLRERTYASPSETHRGAARQCTSNEAHTHTHKLTKQVFFLHSQIALLLLLKCYQFFLPLYPWLRQNTRTKKEGEHKGRA